MSSFLGVFNGVFLPRGKYFTVSFFLGGVFYGVFLPRGVFYGVFLPRGSILWCLPS